MDINFTGERMILGKASKRVEKEHLERYKLAQSYAKGNSILDIACGSGYASEIFIKSQAYQYLGVDINQESVDYANNRYSSNNISFIKDSICSFKHKNKFDVITCFETIEHVECYKKALNNLYSALEDDGTLLISSPNRTVTTPQAITLSETPKNPFHTQEFTINELKNEVVNAGFKIEKILGQRQRPFYGNRFIQPLIRWSRFPDIFGFITSAQLKPVKTLTPKYFIIIAHKI